MTFYEKHVLARNKIQSSRLGFRVRFSSICCLLGYREINIDTDWCEHITFSSARLCLFPSPRKAENPTVSSGLTLSASCRNPPSFQDEVSYLCTWIRPVIQNYCVRSFWWLWCYCSQAVVSPPDIYKSMASPHCEASSTPPQLLTLHKRCYLVLSPLPQVTLMLLAGDYRQAHWVFVFCGTWTPGVRRWHACSGTFFAWVL